MREGRSWYGEDSNRAADLDLEFVHYPVVKSNVLDTNLRESSHGRQRSSETQPSL